MSKLLTVAQVADRLSVCTETVYRYLWAGQLAGTRYRFGWRVTDAELASYLQTRGERPAEDLAALEVSLNGRR